ncbi:MAG: hypothetical protein LBE31_09585 [Deltaproteobacteria bacterium]|jgi:hypothetical protein|nr:hypothetical protein [Deltaproteobacteria bacterium]
MDFNFDSLQSYAQSCLRLAEAALSDFDSPKAVAEATESLNLYPNLSALKAPWSVRSLEDYEGLNELGRQAVLAGRIFWEHPVAGEATRLGVGRKFLLTPSFLVTQAAARGLVEAKEYNDLLPINLGFRHLMQPLLEISLLADCFGVSPVEAIRNQRMLIINASDDGEKPSGLNQAIAKAFSKIMPLENILFMTQASFYGLNRQKGGSWYFDQNSPKRLHNHGQMVMQKTMENQIYHLDDVGNSVFLDRASFFSLLDEYEDLVSYNIEDLDFLTSALDLAALGLAVRLGRSGYGMVMEIILNNPQRPIKGGMCAHDSVLNLDVVVESFRLRDISPLDIKFLNKNFNHYPRPAKVLGSLREKGLFMPVKVIDDRLYFQPVQGDLNFLTRTAFFTRRASATINSLKAPVDIPAALAAMKAQDSQKGFRELSELLGLL